MVKKDDAVSPVIGVMLILVVTIIIAGSVTLFATGLFDDIDSSSVTSLSKVEFIGLETAGGMTLLENGVASWGKKSGFIGLLFEVTGNNPVDLANLKLTLNDRATSQAGMMTISYNDLLSDKYHPVSGSSLNQGIVPHVSLYDAGKVRMVSYPVPSSKTDIQNTLINPGEKFLVVCESLAYMSTSNTIKIGFRVERDDTGNQYASGGYYMPGEISEKTQLLLTDETTGTVLVDCYLSDGVVL